MATDTDTIEYLRFVAEQAEANSREARRRYNDALREAAPFQVGDVAVGLKGTGGSKVVTKILITSTQVRYGNKLSYYGRWAKKDGTWGKAQSEVWGELHPVGWEPTPVPARTVTKDML